jgi:hypothetical protein
MAVPVHGGLRDSQTFDLRQHNEAPLNIRQFAEVCPGRWVPSSSISSAAAQAFRLRDLTRREDSLVDHVAAKIDQLVSETIAATHALGALESKVPRCRLRAKSVSWMKSSTSSGVECVRRRRTLMRDAIT